MDDQLAWITDLLETNGVTHWVESGTLLTLVRSGKLTKYDEDIDIAVLAPDVDILDDLTPQVEAAGYRVQSRSYHGRTYKYQLIPASDGDSRSRDNRRLIDIMVFRRTETFAWTAQSRVKTEFAVPGMGAAIDLVYPLVQQYAQSAGGHIDITSFPKRALVDVLTLSLPRQFVDDIVYDDELGVRRPAAVDEYLSYRYGDWRTPVSEWSLTDDGAVREAEPLTVVRDERYQPSSDVPTRPAD